MSISRKSLLLCIVLLAACSEANNTQRLEEPSEQLLASNDTDIDDPSITEENTLLLDCPDFTDLFALLPEALADVPFSEQYFDCDAVLPKASSTFISVDQQSAWTFSVMALDLDVRPAVQRWQRVDVDVSQKAYLKQALQANLDLELQLYQNCINYLEQAGLPAWHATHQVSTPLHPICIGTDAQKSEDGLWLARAVTPRYLYTLKIDGEIAKQFQTAEATANYLAGLFVLFR